MQRRKPGMRHLLFANLFLLSSIQLIGQTPTLVKDIRSGIGDADPLELVNINGIIFFAANDGSNGRELWKSDGTSAGTVMVKDINTGGNSNPAKLINVNGTLFFTASNGTNGIELWKSDGTSAGTVMVRDIYAGSLNSSPDYLTEVNGTLYFSANNGTNGVELWKSDGTTLGTVMVRDINPGSTGSLPAELFNYYGTLLFSASDGTVGTELWKSNGTSAGTVLVKDIRPGGIGSNSLPKYFTNVNGTIFFQADDGSNGIELWKTDGTSAGTSLILDINPGGSASDPNYLTDVNGVLFFTATKSGQGTELWKSDGTSSGTVLIKDIRAGTSGSTPQNLVNVNGTLFLAANDGLFGVELWKSDGTTLGTIMVKDIKVGGTAAGSFPAGMHNLNGILYFQADDGITGAELWKSDGTVLGTSLVMDIRTGSPTSNPNSLVSHEGVLYFQADDGSTGKELWKLAHCGSYSLAGTPGGLPVGLVRFMNCQPISFFQDKTCNLIGNIKPSGSSYLAGLVNFQVRIDASVQSYNGIPYVQRHYDIIPVYNASLATATVTLYFTQAEFNAFNSNNGVYPDLPVNSTDAAGKSNLMITQFHGTSVTGLPGTYSGTSELINPADANIVWNAARSRWEITFTANGFSGFFVHTGVYILPVHFIQTDVKNSNGVNELNWTISEPENVDRFVLEKSVDGISYSPFSTVSADGTKADYQFSEQNTGNMTFYRIRAELKNGEKLFSRILTIRNAVMNTWFRILSNPVQDRLQFEWNETGSHPVQVSIHSMHGQRLHQSNLFVMQGSRQSIPIGDLKPGTYILQVTRITNGETHSGKFSVTR